MDSYSNVGVAKVDAAVGLLQMEDAAGDYCSRTVEASCSIEEQHKGASSCSTQVFQVITASLIPARGT